MTASSHAAYLDDLGRIAREAAIAEERFRKEAASRAEELHSARAFAYRRLNLVRALGGAVAGAKDEEEALERGRAVFFRETGLNAATQARREAADRFGPVILAVWNATRPEAPEDAATPDARSALAAFESWYEEARNTAFLHLMEREIVELPLVEV